MQIAAIYKRVLSPVSLSVYRGVKYMEREKETSPCCRRGPVEINFPAASCNIAICFYGKVCSQHYAAQLKSRTPVNQHFALINREAERLFYFCVLNLYAFMLEMCQFILAK
jgi:hypothetical protein